MMSLPRAAVRLLSRVPILICALSLATAASAQDQQPEEPRRFCVVERPQPSCETVLVAWLTIYPRLPDDELGTPVEVEVGRLVNLGPADAVGATVVAGVDSYGFRTALKGRYRRWVGRHAAVDAAGGLAFARVKYPDISLYGHHPAFGLTGDVAVGLTDWASVGVRGDLMWAELDRQPVAVTSGAVRLGTRPSILVSTIMVVMTARGRRGSGCAARGGWPACPAPAPSR